MKMRWLVPALMVLGLAACSSAPKKSGPAAAAARPGGVVHGGKSAARGCPEGSPYAPAKEDLSTRGNYTAGGLYKPGVSDTTPDYVPNVACIPEPRVTDEPRSPVGNRSPYTVLGKEYKVMDRVADYAEQGIASYYGSKFHGRLTSNREVYDMYAFTAAHKTLPLPSFARVTNLDNGESVVVRVNDRGPFHDGRVIDLSYAAAVRLGITQRGTGRVEVKGLTPGSDNLLAAGADKPARRAQAASRAAATAAASDMDRLVGKLPPVTAAAVTTARQTVATAPVVARAGAAASAAADAADRSDAWMKDAGVRVASGRAAGTPPPAAAAPAPTASPTLAASALGNVLLQVASFSNRDNATRALGQLASAGIAGASLSDIVSGGRTLWRLRVAANDVGNAAELAGRIAGLGFGQPQIVRD
ncbi:septal ring lytic transglycosylase RlpA family protein [Stenotrophomonas sp. YIM B06876]|uniref:septal ring lytic transglycosylase RlpA family protein n=1 Tax=Stenotrophomonas sp. YIM B06876 TaxID=3060211 RepID=UPI002739FDEF|nr:septal ring lytic transglycosylase RlpA family protein [Stenotrophomonas sp. YIM B06876]